MKNINKLISLILTISLLLSIVSSAIPTYAAEISSQANEITQNGIVDSSRLAEVEEYSHLNADEKSMVCEYYKLTNEMFEECEALGYNIIDSIAIARAAKSANLMPEDYLGYVAGYGSEEEASIALFKLKGYESHIDADYIAEYKRLMKAGHNPDKLFNTYLVARRLQCSISEIVPNENTTTINEEEKTALEEFGAKYYCDPQKLAQSAVAKKVNIAAIIEPAKLETEMMDISAETSATNRAASDEDGNSYYGHHEFISAPSTYFVDGNEYVNASTGGFSYKYNIADWEGRGELNLKLDLVFTSSANMYGGFDFLTGNEVDWYDGRTQIPKPIYTNYGVGWSFDLPSIICVVEWDGTAPGISGLGHSNKVFYYRPQGGGSYKIERNEETNQRELVDYPREDITLVCDESRNYNGIVLREKVLYADGRYEWFDSYGDIRIIGDKWGNEITFDYNQRSGEDDDGEFIEVPFSGALTKVTDSVGRTIEFGYSNDPFPDDDTFHRQIFINYPDYTFEQLNLYAADENSPYLLTSASKGNNGMMFEYEQKEIQCTNREYSGDFDDVVGENIVLNMKSVEYHSGITTHYEYERHVVNNGSGGARHTYRVTRRYETDADRYVEDELEHLRNTTFSYLGEYSGYASRMEAADEDKDLYTDPDNLPEDHSYRVWKVEGLKRTETVFNNDHLMTEVIVKNASNNTTLSSQTIDYDEYERPIKQTSVTGQITAVEQFENDSKGNVLKHWSTYADGEKDDEYATVYTYDSTYNMPLSVTYKRDADTTITENYTLSSDKKHTTQKTISENGIVKEKTEYEYDEYGNVIRERKYKNATEYIDINYDYTDTSRVSRRNGLDFDGGFLTEISQDGGVDIDGNPIGVVSYKYEYDDNGRLLKETDYLGNTTEYHYNAYSLVMWILNPEGKYTRFTYRKNSLDNQVTVKDEMNNEFRYEYDGMDNFINLVDVSTSTSLQSRAYDAWYRISAERNSQGIASSAETTYTYDILGRVTAKETKNNQNATVSKETYAYDDGILSPYIITTHTIVGDATAPSIVTKEYVNSYGNVEKTGYVTGNNEYFTTYEYDYLGTKTEELAAIADQKDWTNEFTSKWDYDYAGRVLRQYNANGDYISHEYDWLGRVVKAYDAISNKQEDPYAVKYDYDNIGNVIRETIPQTSVIDTVREYKYDKANHVILERSLYDIVNGKEKYHETQYAYDWRGNLTSTSNGEYNTTYTYDSLGRCTSSTTDGKTTIYTYDRFGNLLTETFGGKTNTYTYDMNMFRLSHTDRNGIVRTFTPNALQQIATVEIPGELSRNYVYGATGQLEQISSGDNTILRTYNDRGNIVSETADGVVKSYTYDIEGKRESFISAGANHALTYTYNTLGQLASVNENGAPLVTYAYDANGNVTSESKSALTTGYTYNLDSSVASIVTTNNIDNSAATRTYTYCVNGNVKSETLPDGTVKTYSYNERNMLIREALSTGKITDYTYNGSGNRASMTVRENNEETVTNYVYDELNRLTRNYMEKPNGDTERTYYAYDNNGNLILRSREKTTTESATDTFSFGETTPSIDTFAYNGYGEMIKATVNGVTSTYTYRPDGLRQAKTVGGVTTAHVWDGENIIADRNSDNTVKSVYIRGLNLVEYRAGTTTQQYEHNAHGDVTALTDKTSGASIGYDYDAYGNQQTETTSDINPFRYSGEYYDEETGFTYLRARYYDPSIGRFTSEDPIRDGLNWYAYANNNPVMFVDPWGLAIKLVGTTDERKELLGYLQSLTNDTLKITFDENDDCWVYYETSGEKNKPAGTNLVRKIINHKHLVEISVEKKKDSMDPGVGKTRFKPDSQSDSWIYGKGSGGKLYLNREIINVELEDGTTENMSNEIRIGHELVHAYDSINGLRMPIVNGKEEYGAYYHNKNKVYRSGTASINELRTVGLSYINSLGKCVYSSSYVYSENILREEQGLKKRISY